MSVKVNDEENTIYKINSDFSGFGVYKTFTFKKEQTTSKNALTLAGFDKRQIRNLTETNILQPTDKLDDVDNHITKETLHVWKIEFEKSIEEKPKEPVKKTKPDINLPQEGKVLITDFIENVINVMEDTEEVFYREADDEIVEFINHKIKVIKPARAITLIEEYGEPVIERWDSYNKVYVHKQKSATEQTCKVLLESPELKKSLHYIKKTLLTPLPFLIDNKLHFPKRGYNLEMQSYLDQEAPEIQQDIPLKEAKISIINLYKEFCFKNQEDLMRSVMGLLTPFCRGIYEEWNTRTPLFIHFANRERAGKDYLAGIRSIIMDGNAVEQPPISTGEKNTNANEELNKILISALLEGRKTLHFANNKGHLNNSVLEYAITTKIYSGRILGTNKLPQFLNDLEFSMSGNMGCTLSADLANRSCIIELHLAIEDANERGFTNPNLHENIIKKRGYYLGCLYSLVKHWFDKGMPRSEVKFASFPEWAAILGGIIESVGWENPNKVRNQNFGSLEPEIEDMKFAFESAFESYPEQWIDKRTFKMVMQNNELFKHIDWESISGQTKMGYLIDRFVNRELSGITMRGDGNKRKNRERLFFTREVVKSVVLADFYDEIKSGNLGNYGNFLHTDESIQSVVNIGEYTGVAKVPKVTKINNLTDDIAIPVPDFPSLPSTLESSSATGHLPVADGVRGEKVDKIYAKCGYCKDLPAIIYSLGGKPACEFCRSDPNLRKEFEDVGE